MICEANNQWPGITEPEGHSERANIHERELKANHVR